jgi:hypothetical protein
VSDPHGDAIGAPDLSDPHGDAHRVRSVQVICRTWVGRSLATAPTSCPRTQARGRCGSAPASRVQRSWTAH